MKLAVNKTKYIIAAVSLLFVFVDQLIKFVVANSMQLNESIPILNNVLHITYVLNEGAAFSLLSGQSWILCGVTSVIMAALIYLFVSNKSTHILLLSSLGLIISGGIGNLIDRFFNGDIIFQGKVIDYIDFCLIDFAVFNFADCCITIGTVMLVVYLFFFDGKKAKEIEDSKDE